MVLVRQAALEQEEMMLLNAPGGAGPAAVVSALLAEQSGTIAELGPNRMSVDATPLAGVRLPLREDLFPALSLKRRTRWPRR